MTTDRNYSDIERERIEDLAAAYSLGALTDQNDLEEFQRLVESGVTSAGYRASIACSSR